MFHFSLPERGLITLMCFSGLLCDDDGLNTLNYIVTDR